MEKIRILDRECPFKNEQALLYENKLYIIENYKSMADILRKMEWVLGIDDPCGELIFQWNALSSLKKFLKVNGVKRISSMKKEDAMNSVIGLFRDAPERVYNYEISEDE